MIPITRLLATQGSQGPPGEKGDPVEAQPPLELRYEADADYTPAPED